ncbi:MAG: sugar ABC transporter substrate-binding protein [Litorilinea sp.]
MQNRVLSRRQFLIGSSSLAAGALLAACVAPQAAPGTATEAGESAAPSSEPIELVFHSRLGAHADWHKSRVPLFEEQHPGVTLHIDEIPGNEMWPKVYAMAASATIGDVAWTGVHTALEFVRKGVPLPLNDIIEAKTFDTSVYWQAVLNAVTFDGNLYALPNHGNYSTATFYYNVDLYEEAGVALPNPDWTLDDLVSGAQEITNAPEVWGFRTTTSDTHVIQALRMFGGDLINADGTQSLLLEEGSVQGLQWLYDLRNTYEVDPCLCNPGGEIRGGFIGGNVACYNATTGDASELSQVEDMASRWDVTVAPIGPTGERASALSAANFCVTQNSSNPYEAFDVVAFFCSQEDGVLHVLAGAGSPGCRNDVWESPELNDFHPVFGLHREHFPDGPGPRNFPANARTTEFNDELVQNLERIWTGQVEFDQGVEETHEILQQVLDKEPT